MSRQIVVPSKPPGMALWRKHPLAEMARNAAPPMTTFNFPLICVEMGSQVKV